MINMLQQAITAVKTGDKARGQRLLSQVLQTDPHNETACFWMSEVVDTTEQRRAYLERVLAINPDNKLAQRRLAALPQKQSSPPVETNPSVAASDVYDPASQSAAGPAPPPTDLKSAVVTPPAASAPATDLKAFLFKLTKN